MIECASVVSGNPELEYSLCEGPAHCSSDAAISDLQYNPLDDFGSSARGFAQASRPQGCCCRSDLFGLVLPLIGLELTLRFFGPTLPGRYSIGISQVAHPIYGRFQVPSSTGWYRTDEFVSRVQFNALGLRDWEIAPVKPEGERRILVLGDSFVQGAEVNIEDTLTTHLQSRIRAAGHRARVINAGVAGFSTDQQLLLLRNLGWALAPDIVILVFYIGNDVPENSVELTDFVKPYFTLDAQGVLQPHPFEAREDSGAEEVTAWIRRQSQLAGMIDTGVVPKLRTLPGMAKVPSVDHEVVGPITVGAGPGGSDVYRAEMSSSWRHAWAVTDALIHELAEESRQHSIPLVLVIAPSKWEVHTEDWELLLRQNNLPNDGWDLDAPARRIAAMSEREGVPFISPLAVLRESARSKRYYFRQDVHWTAAGHRAVADVLADGLLDSRLVFAWDPS
jgi:lysophospholipase L1-like esterase